MKPSVRVEGQFADQVPRPVQGGKVIAVSLSALDQSTSLDWGTLADPRVRKELELHPCQILAAPVYKRGKDDVPP